MISDISEKSVVFYATASFEKNICAYFGADGRKKPLPSKLLAGVDFIIRVLLVLFLVVAGEDYSAF